MKRNILFILFASALCLFSADHYTFNGEAIQTGETILSRTIQNGKLILNMRKDEPHFYPEGTQTTVTCWQEVYGVSNGIVVLETNIPAIYTPPRTTQEIIQWQKP